MKRKCLLCPTMICHGDDIYCSTCGWDVWAIRGNAERLEATRTEKRLWNKLQRKITAAMKELKP